MERFEGDAAPLRWWLVENRGVVKVDDDDGRTLAAAASWSRKLPVDDNVDGPNDDDA